MALTVTLEKLGAMRLRPLEVVRIIKRVNLVYPTGWLVRFFPLHFGAGARRRYGYTPRAGESGSGKRFRGSYTWRKLRRYHHTRPLEWTGKGKATAMAGRRASSTRNSASASVPGRVWNLRNPNSQVDMRRELTTVLDAEQARLEADAQLKTDAEFNRAAARA